MYLFALFRSSMRSSECFCLSELFLVTLSSVSRRFSTLCLSSPSLEDDEDPRFRECTSHESGWETERFNSTHV